jgi:hypothetical protein
MLYSFTGPVMVTSFVGSRTFVLKALPLVCLQSVQWHTICNVNVRVSTSTLIDQGIMINILCIVSQPRRKGGEGETRTCAVWVDLSSIVVCPQRQAPLCGIFKL